MSGTSDATVASEDARAIRRIVVVGSASGSGKTTLARELAAHLAVPFVEVDALYHGPNWTPTPTEILRERVSAVVSQDGWVIDGSYHRQLGTLVLDRAQLLVWLDLPTRVWLPRLLLRSMRRWATGEVLWNGNRESLRDLFWGREALIPRTRSSGTTDDATSSARLSRRSHRADCAVRRKSTHSVARSSRASECSRGSVSRPFAPHGRPVEEDSQLVLRAFEHSTLRCAEVLASAVLVEHEHRHGGAER